MFKKRKKKDMDFEFKLKMIERIDTLLLQNEELYSLIHQLEAKIEYLEKNLDTVHDEYTQIKGMIYTGR